MTSELVATTEIPFEEKHIYFCKRGENGTVQIWRAKSGRQKKDEKGKD